MKKNSKYLILILMSNIQDRNNITNCYIYYLTSIILRLADQQII